MFKNLFATCAVCCLMGTASAQTALTPAQARAAIMPLYTTFTQPVAGDVKTLLEQGTTSDWKSCASETECRGREESIKVFLGFGKALPDMKHSIQEIIVSGDTVVVRGELSGTPAGDFFGVPHTGRSFTIMTMDKHAVKDGKLAHTYHLEDWASAIRQLTAK